MAPDLGLILTSSPDLSTLRAALAAARCRILKVVPAWGLAAAWSQASIAEACRLADRIVVRTSWGDPSYAGGARSHPDPDQIVAELRDWLACRPDAIIELGNEPLIAPAEEQEAWRYLYYLDRAIDACRAAFPRAMLLAPAHMIDHPVALGPHPDGVARWLAIAAPVLRRCDGLSLHAYSAAQLARGLGLLRQVDPRMPIWLTEFGLPDALPPNVRAQRYLELLSDTPVDAALLYHLDRLGGPRPMPDYNLSDDDLAALGAAAAATDPDTVHYPEVRVDDVFKIDVRQWRTVAAFRRHLANYSYRQTAPWARGVVIHHSVNPTAPMWRGAASILAMARFYRYEVENADGGKGGWTSGPHLFAASGSPDARQDGLWQMTPLNLPGTHARAANTSFWGIEHVGDYTRLSWPPDVAALGAGCAAALLDWASLPTSPATVTPHSQWGKKECPGAAIDMAAVRRAIAALRGAR